MSSQSRTLPATSSSPPATSSRGRLRFSPDFFRKQMVTRNRPTWFLVFTAVNLSLPVLSAISTSTPTPPLQWLNITRLLSGSGAPPLKGASIGYDETVRTLIVFGGESESGFPTSTTYLCVRSIFSDIPESNAESHPQSQFRFAHMVRSSTYEWSRRDATTSKQSHQWIRLGCKSASVPYRDWRSGSQWGCAFGCLGQCRLAVFPRDSG